MSMINTRESFRPYISVVIDDALSADHTIADVDGRATLVGWQCGFEPMIVAVIGATMDTAGLRDIVDAETAEDIAKDYLVERGWFSAGPTDAGFIMRGK